MPRDPEQRARRAQREAARYDVVGPVSRAAKLRRAALAVSDPQSWLECRVHEEATRGCPRCDPAFGA